MTPGNPRGNHRNRERLTGCINIKNMTLPPLHGLILTGGHSTRMGSPKCLLDYHGKPQYRHAAALLAPFCERVFLSCREAQQDWFEGFPLVFDMPDFGGIGPMSGVLSAMKGSPSPSAWFVLGCDYPMLESADVAQLIAARDPKRVATAFLNPDTKAPEPLVAMYESAARDLMLEWFGQGNQSLRVFLELNDVVLVRPDRPARLESVDTPGQVPPAWYRRLGTAGFSRRKRIIPK